MEVLHYIGLTRDHQNCFSAVTLEEAIVECEQLGYHLLKNLLEMVTENNDNSPIIVDDNLTTAVFSSDGRQIRYYTTRYERKKTNREEAIRIHGTTCMACGFNFEKMYGQVGKDYIDVHHIVPLSSIKQEVLINPQTDLICLCPNCHRMIHKKDVLTLEKLKQLIEENGSSS